MSASRIVWSSIHLAYRVQFQSRILVFIQSAIAAAYALVGSVRVFRNFQCVSAAEVAQEADHASRIATLSGSKPNSERYA